MLHSLHAMNARLDATLAPPYPKTPEDIAAWIPADRTDIKFPGPVLPKWTPPNRVPRTPDGGFWLAQHVLCYQRGYHPDDLMQAYLQVAGVSFGAPAQLEEEGLNAMAYDFFVVVITHDRKVVGGCVVELRPAVPTSPDDTAYLYISTLCIDKSYGSKGLAHQLVHSVYTLTSLVMEQNDTSTGIWHDAIPNNHAAIALFVGRTPTSDKSDRLIKLYSQCGLTMERANQAVYRSFTPYSIYEWCLEKEGYFHIPMWKTVCPGVLYEDENVRVLSPNRKDGTLAYHAFPAKHAKSVRTNGLIALKHTCLHKNTDELYTPGEISFQKGSSTQKGVGTFQLLVQTKLDVFVIRISIPAWFAYGTTDATTVK